MVAQLITEAPCNTMVMNTSSPEEDAEHHLMLALESANPKGKSILKCQAQVKFATEFVAALIMKEQCEEGEEEVASPEDIRTRTLSMLQELKKEINEEAEAYNNRGVSSVALRNPHNIRGIKHPQPLTREQMMPKSQAGIVNAPKPGDDAFQNRLNDWGSQVRAALPRNTTGAVLGRSY